MKRAGDFDCGAVARLLIAMEMALQFDVNIVVSENSDKTIYGAACFFRAAVCERESERAIIAAGQTNQAGTMLFEFVFQCRAFIFFGAQLHFGDQPAEV